MVLGDGGADDDVGAAAVDPPSDADEAGEEADANAAGYQNAQATKNAKHIDEGLTFLALSRPSPLTRIIIVRNVIAPLQLNLRKQLH
eukprot:1025252-Pyramimonas_sp.AAC.1